MEKTTDELGTSQEKSQTRDTPLYDERVHSAVKSLIADEYIAWQTYFLMNIATGNAGRNDVKVLFDIIAHDELDDHYNRLVQWCQLNNWDVPVSVAEMQRIANDPLKKINYKESPLAYISRAIESENAALAAYKSVIDMPEIEPFPELKGMLESIHADEQEHHDDLTELYDELVEMSTTEKSKTHSIVVVSKPNA